MKLALTKKSRISIILISLSFFLSLGVSALGLFKSFEHKAYDLLSKTCNPASGPESVVIVKVDQASLDSLKNEGIPWPWPRQVYAALIDHLSEAEAVFLDILFLEPSSYGHHDDLVLSEALKASPHVYLPLALTNRKEGLSDAERAFLEQHAMREQVAPGPAFRSAILPLDLLRPVAAGAGNVSMRPDEDGVYRGVPLIFRVDKYTLPHFVLDYLVRKQIVTVKQGELFSGDARIPLSDGRLLLRYPRGDHPFASLSAADVLKAHADAAAQQKPSAGKEHFRGKYVFVGLTAAGLFDLKPTSVSAVATGVDIHAATLENILNRNFIRPLSMWYAVAFMVLICASATLLVMKYKSLVASGTILLGGLAMVVFVPAAVFAYGFYLPTVSPVLSLVLSFGMAGAYSYATEAKERRFVRRVFSQYMDETVVRHVLKHPEIIRPGGQKRFVTIFFMDIAGFTSLAEKLEAEQTASMLHAILDGFTEAVIAEGGVIDKYIGDSLMAFWGAPIRTDSDAVRACSAALRCIGELEGINRRFTAEGLPSVSVRIGIHSGEVIVGNLGSTRLFDYTVVGDPVNITSRLESANKLFRTKIIVSEETLGRTGGRFLARELGLIELKGKSVPLRIFELVDDAAGAADDQRSAVRDFNGAIALYQEGRVPEALALFEDLIHRYPGDGPSVLYAARCRELLQEPSLTEDWKIVKMSEK